ncbi:CCAAT/enhancer-binding protein beta-like [Cloeon dipterum]|uniref:CCAAT/enhancer-binding protein beta-like n=1 Tax=Cloeon dipterum TaxID=197152 RepID=UPI00321F9736
MVSSKEHVPTDQLRREEDVTTSVETTLNQFIDEGMSRDFLDEVMTLQNLPIPASIANETKVTEFLPASGNYFEFLSGKDGHDRNPIGGSSQIIAQLPPQLIFAPVAELTPSGCSFQDNRVIPVARKLTIGGKAEVDKNSPEYREKRNKNNEAVKKSRRKAKERENEIKETNKILKDENEQLKKVLAYLKAVVDKYRGSVKINDHEFQMPPSFSGM